MYNIFFSKLYALNKFVSWDWNVCYDIQKKKGISKKQNFEKYPPLEVLHIKIYIKNNILNNLLYIFYNINL